MLKDLNFKLKKIKLQSHFQVNFITNANILLLENIQARSQNKFSGGAKQIFGEGHYI
jgi:hypothetical protein